MYTYALAERLHKTRDEILDTIDAPGLTRWMAFDRARGPTQQDWLMARLCTLFAQFAGDKRARPERFLKEVYPHWKPPKARRAGSTITFRGGRRDRGAKRDGD